MPGGHASHKGTSDKPNVNASGQVSVAADKTATPEDMLREEGMEATTESTRHADAPNPAAVERPAATHDNRDSQRMMDEPE